jgi:hypothetical protein
MLFDAPYTVVHWIGHYDNDLYVTLAKILVEVSIFACNHAGSIWTCSTGYWG